ncbi:transposase [Pseudonocardia sp. ICBG1293]|uniref:transposase n=1 Tax=Pseudonocardia sp. ICBG1293 TaxID=2844382 RepID=UPI001CCDD0B3|nr:transposase [Pseudonocardia sp. ICBG1293]
MPAPHPPEFRQRAIDLARSKVKPISEIAKDLSLSESCLRNWVSQADADDGDLRSTRLSSAEKSEIVELRKKARRIEIENEILKRAAAYFARENILPK